MSNAHYVCPSCKCHFVQPFVCITCGAEKLYDATVRSQQDTITSLRSQLSAATAALEAAQKDAERYRWLRDKASEGTWRELAEVTAAGTDRAIDAARREGGGE
jgi:multidrug resistance efflux pump